MTDEIRENPGFTDGAGDSDLGVDTAEMAAAICGAGKVIKPESFVDALAFTASFFLLLVRSVLPLDSG